MTIDQSNKQILTSLKERLKYPLCVSHNNGFYVGNYHVFITDNISGEILCAVPFDHLAALLVDLMNNKDIDVVRYPTKEEQDRKLAQAIADAIDGKSECDEISDNQRSVIPNVIIINGSCDISKEMIEQITKAFSRGKH